MDQTVQTDRLVLRPLQDEDETPWIRMHEASDALFRPWMPRLEEGTTWRDLFLHTLSHASRAEAEDTGLVRIAVPIASPDEIVGVFSLSQIFRRAFQNAYAGWRVSALHQGEGFATESMRAMLDLAFGSLGLHRVQANVIPTNHASLRVAHKIGMRREGYAERYLQIDGTWQDHVMFARTSDEHRPRG